MNDDDRHRRNHEEGIDERQDNRNHKINKTKVSTWQRRNSGGAGVGSGAKAQRQT